MKLRWDLHALMVVRLYHRYRGERHEAAGKSFVVRVAEVAGRLLTLPMSGRPFGKKGLRFVAVPGTPYIIVYRVQGETVDIVTMIYIGDE
jgi:plasmid stabilization system protein ParE